MLQMLAAKNKLKMREFCCKIQLKMEDGCYVERLIFSHGATFHIRDKVNRADIRI